MYRESLGGISVVSQLALMSARCLQSAVSAAGTPTPYSPTNRSTGATGATVYWTCGREKRRLPRPGGDVRPRTALQAEQHSVVILVWWTRRLHS